MNKRIWINIGLFITILFLSLYIILSNKKTLEQPLLLSKEDRNLITRIEIIRHDRDNFSFLKKDDSWYMQSPLQLKANLARINSMLKMLNIESHGNLNPADVNLKKLELDEPKLIMKLDEYEFKFGNTDAINQYRYILFNKQIHLVNDSLYEQLMIHAAFFADTKLFKPDTEITMIEYPKNKLEKINGVWQLQTMTGIKPNELQNIVLTWQNATAISTSHYQEPEDKELIKVTTKDNQKIVFIIVSKEPHLVIGRKNLGIQYNMSSNDTRSMLLNENGTEENNSEFPLQLID